MKVDIKRAVRGTLAAISAIALGFIVLWQLSIRFRVICAYCLAVLESNRLESDSVKTRPAVESKLFLVSKEEPDSVTKLFAIHFLIWNSEKNAYVGSFKGRFIYTPKKGDQYVAYKILGIMPIDFIFDKQGNILYWCPSFDY